MDSYFGDLTPGGRVFGTSHQGTAGVLQIRLNVDPPGTRPRLDPEATTIIGMNSTMKTAILADAENELDRIRLPKEVHVHTDYGRAVIAIDERNQVRDVLNWDDVVRKVGIDSGHKFWRLWGKGLKVK